MDTLRLARYPFLQSATQFVAANGVDIAMLLTDPQCETARIRGVERVEGAIRSYSIPPAKSLMSDYDRLMEVLSYPYARILVSRIGDKYLTKRYALAEAKHMYETLKGDRASVFEIAERLEVSVEKGPDDLMLMPFTDFVRYASTLKAMEWKLINQEIHDGKVLLETDKFSRLLEMALQEDIERNLPNVPEDFDDNIRSDVSHISLVLGERKKALDPTGGEGLKTEYLPPCIKTILANAQNGMNLPHSARFALVTFLHALGVTYDGIIALFSQSPDFDESKSSYQIKHITGELNGGDGYTPPTCSTMRSQGICFEPDDLCNQDWLNHPLSYYRAKAKKR